MNNMNCPACKSPNFYYCEEDLHLHKTHLLEDGTPNDKEWIDVTDCSEIQTSFMFCDACSYIEYIIGGPIYGQEDY